MSFAHPNFLWLIASIAVLCVFALRSRYKNQTTLKTWSSISPSLDLPFAPSTWLSLIALLAIVIAIVTPRWGTADSPGILKGRDVVIILDLSKSMEAADMADPKFPQRWQSAREAVVLFIDDLKQRGGGHRIAIVAFAAKPVPICPLTIDRDHFRHVLSELSIVTPPTGIYPNDDERWTSGTRIGAAIRFAVEMHDPKFEGYQDCILISDGDDPGPDRDSEIDTGIAVASERHIPIHTVGIGDAKEGGQIIVDGVPVQTKLEEVPLRAIARRTEAFYLSAGRETPELTRFFREKIEPRPSRELPEELLPQPRERRIWFLLSAIALLCLAWRRE